MSREERGISARSGAGCARRGDAMDEIGEHAWIISIVGDFLTLFGAYWTARAVILTKQTADEIPRYRTSGANPLLATALLDQSRAAMVGLVCVAVGAGFQIVSKLIEESFRRASPPSSAR